MRGQRWCARFRNMLKGTQLSVINIAWWVDFLAGYRGFLFYYLIMVQNYSCMYLYRDYIIYQILTGPLLYNICLCDMNLIRIKW